MPKISIIMGTYNGASTISNAIESILNQSFNDLELIICDDNSSDGTVDIINTYITNDKRVVLIRNEKNSGLAVSLNKCIEVSKAELIGRMDDDDIAHLNRIEVQIKHLDAHPEFAVVGSSINYFDENGIWGELNYSGERSLIEIYKGISFVHPTVIMRKDALNAVGNYTVSSQTRRGQDYDLWCKFYFAGYRGTNLELVLLDYCESQESVKRRKFIYRYNVYKKKRYWRRRFSLPLYYSLYAYKELIAGLVPKKILLIRRKLKTAANKDMFSAG